MYIYIYIICQLLAYQKPVAEPVRFGLHQKKRIPGGLIIYHGVSTMGRGCLLIRINLGCLNFRTGHIHIRGPLGNGAWS